MKIRIYILFIILFFIFSPYLLVFSQSISFSQHERIELARYKGVRLTMGTYPFIYPSLVEQGIFPSHFKNKNVNTISLIMFYKVDKEGNIHPIPFSKIITRLMIRRYHNAGFAVCLSPAILKGYLSFGPLPEDILEKENFWRNLKKITVETAKIAEEEKVEVFFASNELELLLSGATELEKGLGVPEEKRITACERALNFSREILPEIRKVFHGKVGWHSMLEIALDWEAFNKNQSIKLFCPQEKLNFSGYDFYGSTVRVFTNNPSLVKVFSKGFIRMVSEIAKQSNASLAIPETIGGSTPEHLRFFIEEALKYNATILLPSYSFNSKEFLNEYLPKIY